MLSKADGAVACCILSCTRSPTPVLLGACKLGPWSLPVTGLPVAHRSRAAAHTGTARTSHHHERAPAILYQTDRASAFVRSPRAVCAVAQSTAAPGPALGTACSRARLVLPALCASLRFQKCGAGTKHRACSACGVTTLSDTALCSRLLPVVPQTARYAAARPMARPAPYQKRKRRSLPDLSVL